MTAESIAAVAGSLLSLFFTFAPGVKGRWEGLGGDQKRWIMAGLLLLVALGTWVYTCGGWQTECLTNRAPETLSALLAALAANQATFLLTAPRNAKPQ